MPHGNGLVSGGMPNTMHSDWMNGNNVGGVGGLVVRGWMWHWRMMRRAVSRRWRTIIRMRLCIHVGRLWRIVRWRRRLGIVWMRIIWWVVLWVVELLFERLSVHHRVRFQVGRSFHTVPAPAGNPISQHTASHTITLVYITAILHCYCGCTSL